MTHSVKKVCGSDVPGVRSVLEWQVVSWSMWEWGTEHTAYIMLLMHLCNTTCVWLFCNRVIKYYKMHQLGELSLFDRLLLGQVMYLISAHFRMPIMYPGKPGAEPPRTTCIGGHLVESLGHADAIMFIKKHSLTVVITPPGRLLQKLH